MRRHLSPRPFRVLLAALLTVLACSYLPRAGGLAWGTSPPTPQIAADAYEPDGSSVFSSTIAPGATQKDHNFDRPADEDWVQFGAAAGNRPAADRATFRTSASKLPLGSPR